MTAFANTITIRARTWTCPHCRAEYESSFGRMTCGAEPCLLAEARARGNLALVTAAKQTPTHLMEVRWRAAGIPALYATAELADFEADHTWTDRRNVRIIGAPGRGKTHLACALLKAAMRRGASGLFVSAAGYLKAVKATYRKGSRESEADVLAAHTEPDVLVLDDLGGQQGSDFTLAELLTLIEARLWARKTTVVTSNLQLVEIHAQEPRMASRLRDWRLIELTGTDRRARA